MARKSIVSKKIILKNSRIKKTDLCYKRPGTGVSPFLFSKFINKKSKKFIQKDTILKLKDFKWI